jgi:hypothetical protein
VIQVAIEGVPAAVGRLVGAAEPRKVGADDPMASLHERRHQLAVEIGPARLAVKTDDGPPVAWTLVDVVQPQAVDLRVVGLEVVAGQALEALVRRAEDFHGPEHMCLRCSLHCPPSWLP